MKRVVILGGGITGLTTAFYLKTQAKSAGLDLTCTVLEQSSRFGGKIDTIRQDGFVMEKGPESLLARKPAGIELIRSLGLESEIVSTVPENQKTFIAHDGGLVPMPTGTNLGVPVRLQPFLESPLLSTQGKARALADLLLPSGHSEHDESLGSLLRRRFGDELVTRLCEPLLAGIYAGGVDSLSADATFPQFRAMERDHRSLILAAREAVRKAQGTAPSPNHGRSTFITLRGGLLSLIERLYDCLRDWADLQTDATATQVTRSGSGYDITYTRNQQHHTVHADALVITTPAPVAKSLLATLAPDAAELMDIPYVSTATVILGYHKEQTMNQVVGSGFVVPRDENLPITACTYLSNKWSHVAPRDYSVVRCYIGRRGQTKHLNGTDDDLVRLATDSLRSLVGITAAPTFTRVTRWESSMPQYQVGHLDRLNLLEERLSAEVPGVLLAGGGYRGVGIPDCIVQARRAVDTVIAHCER